MQNRSVLVVASALWALGCGTDATTPGGDSGGGGDDAFTLIYNSSTFQMCSECHAPGAPGFVDGTEATQNWSSRDSAKSSLMGNASGLIGNFAGCNGVPLIGDTPETSLLVAALDEDVRAQFASGGCDSDAIADETLKIGGAVDGATLDQLKQWISDGAL